MRFGQLALYFADGLVLGLLDRQTGRCTVAPSIDATVRAAPAPDAAARLLCVIIQSHNAAPHDPVSSWRFPRHLCVLRMRGAEQRAAPQRLTSERARALPGQVGENDSVVMLRPTELAPGLYQPLPRPVAAGTDGWTPKAQKCGHPRARYWPLPRLRRARHPHTLSHSMCLSWRMRPKPSEHGARSQMCTALRGA